MAAKMAAITADNTSAQSMLTHNYCSRADSLVKLVANYRFLSIGNATKYIKIISVMYK